MPAVSTMILRSMRLIGEKERGDTLSADEAIECLDELNTAMESWSIDRLNIYQITEAVHALTASTSTYTIGTNGVISTVARPIKVVDPSFTRDSSGYDTPLRIVSKETYDSIVDKDAGYTVPELVYYDAGYSATSTATIALYPVPGGGNTLHLNIWQPLQTFASVTTQLLLPPGYRLFIESNFAIHLAGGYTNVPGSVMKMAQESKAAIQSINLPESIMTMDTGNVVYGAYGAYGGSRRNIFTG